MKEDLITSENAVIFTLPENPLYTFNLSNVLPLINT